jgi:hypothetical protein
MTSLTYSDSNHTLTFSTGGSFEAYNNVDSKSAGKWPKGTFKYERHTTHADDSEDSAYGSNGNFIFTVPNRTDMGIHSGRKNKADGLGRKGPKHATMGCIRTTDEATAKLLALANSGSIKDLTVE